MKYIKLSFLFSLFCLFFLVSCSGDDEPIDPALLIPAPEECNAPSFFNVSDFINGNTVRIGWDKTSADEWELQYGISGFEIGAGTIVPFNITSSLISGLNSANTYDFYIRTKCSADEFSDWIGPLSPGSALEGCSSPTNLAAVRSLTDATKVTVSWSESMDGNSYQVQYGIAGFTIGSPAGTILAAATSPKVVSNLEGNVSYDFYVRANCEANQNSTWVGPINIVATGQTGSPYYLRLKSDGVLVSFSPDNSNASYSALAFMISALNVGGNSFNLQVFAPQGIGTYAFANPDIDAVCTFSESATIFSSSYSDFTNSTGNVVITQLDLVNNRVKGTFNFVGKDDPLTQSRVISEGEFYLPLD